MVPVPSHEQVFPKGCLLNVTTLDALRQMLRYALEDYPAEDVRRAVEQEIERLRRQARHGAKAA